MIIAQLGKLMTVKGNYWYISSKIIFLTIISLDQDAMVLNPLGKITVLIFIVCLRSVVPTSYLYVSNNSLKQ